MIAPGKISTSSKSRNGQRHCTIVYTTAGFELIVSGQGTQKIAVHVEDKSKLNNIAKYLKQNKALNAFAWKERHSKLEL